MHTTSLQMMSTFIDVHLKAFRGTQLQVLDFGSQVVNDSQALSYRDLLDDPLWTYNGVDIEAGRNVDIVLADPYRWTEIPPESADLVVSGQAFEHVQFPWSSMFEIARVLRPGGVAAIIAPSAGYEHRYPLDCWRFYPDGFSALAEYVGCDVVDVYTDFGHGVWEDSMLIARKPVWNAEQRSRFARRITLQRDLVSEPSEHHRSHELVAVGDPAPSPLAALRPGALTAAFVAAAEQRVIDAQPVPVPPAVKASLPARCYGAVRRVIAAAAGPRGRQFYKRLRGRA
jgi:SAM-dependent methyltransferase